MARECFTYEGLDPIAERIRRNADDIGYLVVVDRTDRRVSETLGRFDLTEEHALPYMEDPPDDEEPEDLERSFFDEDEVEEDAEPEDEPPAARGPVPMAEIAEASIRWVRDIAARNTVGEEWRRFRVKVFSPKGVRQIDSGQFVCRNRDHENDVEKADELLAELRIPEPNLERAEKAGMAKGIRALGDYYAQWGQIVLGSMGQLQGVNNATVARLHRQLQESREHIDELIAAMLETRIAETKLANERKTDEQAADARTVLAQHALQQLGDAAKAFLTAKGVSPEMADLLGVLGHSPELVAALSDPDVRNLMNDPSNLRALASMLKGAAQQARAAQQATGAATAG